MRADLRLLPPVANLAAAAAVAVAALALALALAALAALALAALAALAAAALAAAPAAPPTPVTLYPAAVSVLQLVRRIAGGKPALAAELRQRPVAPPEAHMCQPGEATQ